MTVLKMQYILLTLQQTAVCSLAMDTLRGLGPAAYFCQQTSSQTQCLLAHPALSEQTKGLFVQRKYLNTLKSQITVYLIGWECCRYSLGTV